MIDQGRFQGHCLGVHLGFLQGGQMCSGKEFRQVVVSS